MANFFYVKSGGTAVGSAVDVGDGVYTTQQTGTFASLADTYPALGDIMVGTVVPVSGDYVFVSTSHAETGATNRDIGVNSSGMGEGIHIISVDDSNCDSYLKATSTQITNSALYTYRQAHLYGISWSHNVLNGITVSPASSLVTFNDCDFESSGTSDDAIFNLTLSWGTVIFNDCDFTIVNGTVMSIFAASNQSRIFFNNCTSGITGTGNYEGLTRSSTTNVFIECRNCTWTDIPVLLHDAGGLIGDDFQTMNLYNCELEPSATLANETLTLLGQQVNLYGCTDATDSTPNRISTLGYVGTVDSIIDTAAGSGIVRTDGAALSMESGTSFMSLKATTNTLATIVNSLSLPDISKFSELSGVAQTVRLYLASSDATLTDADVLVDIGYKDGTNIETPVTASVKTFVPLETGTTLSTDAVSTWVNAGALTKYYIDIDTSGTAGADCVPIVRIRVTKPSTTIYFESEFDLV